MLRRTAGRIAALGLIVGALACVRDDWKYVARDVPETGAPSEAAVDVTDVGVATDTTDAGFTDAGFTDAGFTDAGFTDAGFTDAGFTDLGATDSGSVCPATMLLIPAGQFLMGDPTGLEPLALPVHGVRLSAFCLDVVEVSVAAYRACPAAGCTTPGTLAGCNWGVTGRDDHPLNCVTAEQAIAYCQWRSDATLPTEAQLEYAARLPDDRLYPWGNTPAASQLCWSGGGTIQSSTCPVRSFPTGASSLGLYDLGGNVAEFTSGWYYTYSGDAGSYETDPTGPSTGTLRVIRGGTWRSSSDGDVRSAYREALDVPFSSGVGLRCMRAVR